MHQAQELTQSETPKCVAVFEKGITTKDDFCRGMAALMSDLAAMRMEEKRANAICNAGGKLLKAVEMEQKHRQTQGDSGLRLIGEP